MTFIIAIHGGACLAARPPSGMVTVLVGRMAGRIGIFRKHLEKSECFFRFLIKRNSFLICGQVSPFFAERMCYIQHVHFPGKDVNGVGHCQADEDDIVHDARNKEDFLCGSEKEST